VAAWGDNAGNVAVEVAGSVVYLPRQASAIASVALSPDGSTVAIVLDGSSQVKVYRLNRGTPILLYTTARAAVRLGSVAFSPDGSTLAAAGATQGNVYLYAAATGNPTDNFVFARRAFPSPPAFSTDSKQVVIADGGSSSLFFYNIGTKTLSRPEQTYQDTEEGRSIAVSPDGQTVAVGAEDGWVALVTVRPTGTTTRLIQVAVPAPGRPALVSVAFSRTGEYLITADGNGNVASWKFSTGAGVVSAPLRGGKPLYGIAVSPDGKQFTVASDAGWVGRLSLKNWTPGDPP
jgi:WD40 repeat protein